MAPPRNTPLYSAPEAPFLARLRQQTGAQHPHSDPDRHAVPQIRAGARRGDGGLNEDDGPVIVDEMGDIVEGRVGDDGVVVRTVGEGTAGGAIDAVEGEKEGGKEDRAGEDESGKVKEAGATAVVGRGARKRKIGRVVGTAVDEDAGGDGDDDDERPQTAMRKSENKHTNGVAAAGDSTKATLKEKAAATGKKKRIKTGTLSFDVE